MYDPERDLPAVCNTSDINEELGLVTHLFTDKTGTLTRNVMVFKEYAHGGDAAPVPVQGLEAEAWSDLLMVMLLCHSVQVCPVSGAFVASSPDEKAILEACRDAGFVYEGCSIDGRMTVLIEPRVDGAAGGERKRKIFQKLEELEFDSFRKCMSVIVRDCADGKIHVLSKGAESTMLEKCSDSGSAVVAGIAGVVNDFAVKGLRTLVLGYRRVTDDEYGVFKATLELARQSIVNRTKFEREAYAEVETHLRVVGATGIEDLLQEDVVETVNMIKAAGIVPWMLTGDKKETAVNLAQAAGLLQVLNEIKVLKPLQYLRHCSARVAWWTFATSPTSTTPSPRSSSASSRRRCRSSSIASS